MSKIVVVSVKPCQCAHEFQDKTYGKGLRLHNQAGGAKSVSWRCTVCGTKR